MQRFLVFISVFSLMIGLAYYYVGNRILEGYEISFPVKTLFWFCIGLLTLLTPAAYLSSLFLEDSNWQRTLSFIAFTSLGFITILFSLMVFHDFSVSIVNGFHWFISFFRHAPDIVQVSADSINRKEFLLSLLKPAVAATAVSLTGYGLFRALHRVEIKNVDVPVSNLHPELSGFKIVQISDIHIGPTIGKEFLESIVSRINELNADLIAITGDLVDGSVHRLKEHIAPLGDLRSKYGSFFVTGNHEYYSGVMSWLPEIRNLGINVLLNQNEIIRHGKAKLMLAGVTDYKAHSILPSHASDPNKAAFSKEDSHFKVLLAHQPNSIFEATKAGFDLQLSGHTHGGQYFPGNFLIHLFQKFVAGLYKHENTWLYVSSGTGYWGPPLRIGAPAEITVIQLRNS